MNVKKDNYYLGNVLVNINVDNYNECEFADMSEAALEEVERLMDVK